jgi:arylsulfatase A-like enzyme
MEGARPFRNARWGVLAVALLVACCTVSAPEPEAELPDVLLVVLDTVRADRLSTYGYERPTSIQLDALAQAGVVFEDVTAPASWTWPSHASLFTGTPPWVHGAHVV